MAHGTWTVLRPSYLHLHWPRSLLPQWCRYENLMCLSNFARHRAWWKSGKRIFLPSGLHINVPDELNNPAAWRLSRHVCILVPTLLLCEQSWIYQCAANAKTLLCRPTSPCLLRPRRATLRPSALGSTWQFLLWGSPSAPHFAPSILDSLYEVFPCPRLPCLTWKRTLWLACGGSCVLIVYHSNGDHHKCTNIELIHISRSIASSSTVSWGPSTTTTATSPYSYPSIAS